MLCTRPAGVQPPGPGRFRKADRWRPPTSRRSRVQLEDRDLLVRRRHAFQVNLMANLTSWVVERNAAKLSAFLR